MNAIQTIPAEIVRPGIALQRVNATNADGTFLRQVKFRGTEEEARAYVAMLAGGEQYGQARPVAV